MADLNRVFLAGRLTRDPELRYTSGGQAVCDLSLATGRTFITKSGDKKEEVVFVDVIVWGRQAETAGEYLSKGSPLLVEGRLQFDAWETKEGEKRNKLKVLATRIQFLGRARAKNDEDVGEEEVEENTAAPAEKGKKKEDDIPF